jgi:hypothetical protein
VPVQSQAALSAIIGLGRAETVERHSSDERRKEGSILDQVCYRVREYGLGYELLPSRTKDRGIFLYI